MVFRTSITILITVNILMILTGYSCANQNTRLKKMEEVSQQIANEKNHEIVFYGKVVSFEGEPISEANVKMHIRVFGDRKQQSPFTEVNIVTDNNGLFSVIGFGELITLDDIVKDGYVYHYKYNHDRSRWSVKAQNRKRTGFQPDRPLTFRVRKEAPPAFVLIGNWNFGLRAGGSKLLDLYRREWAEPGRLSAKKLNDPDWKTDVSVRAEKEGDSFKLILETVEKDSGFVVATPEFVEEMTEAPEQGYRSKIVVPIARDSVGRLFAYVKNDGGLFYSKIYVNYANREGRDYVELDWGYFTNVAGERGLEFVSQLAQKYRDDAKARRRPWLKREHLISGNVTMPVLGVE